MSPCRRYCPPADPVAHVWQGQRAGRFLPHNAAAGSLTWCSSSVLVLVITSPIADAFIADVMAVLDNYLQTRPSPGRRTQDTGETTVSGQGVIRYGSPLSSSCSCFSLAQVNQYQQPSIAICSNERRAAGQRNASSPTALTGVTVWGRPVNYLIIVREIVDPPAMLHSAHVSCQDPGRQGDNHRGLPGSAAQCFDVWIWGLFCLDPRFPRGDLGLKSHIERKERMLRMLMSSLRSLRGRAFPFSRRASFPLPWSRETRPMYLVPPETSPPPHGRPPLPLLLSHLTISHSPVHAPRHRRQLHPCRLVPPTAGPSLVLLLLLPLLRPTHPLHLVPRPSPLPPAPCTRSLRTTTCGTLTVGSSVSAS